MEFQTAGRRGLAASPIDGWPLDHLLVGVATLRTTRQLLRPTGALRDASVRPWDVALWSGVTPQGTRHCMERLCQAGLVQQVARGKSWHAATGPSSQSQGPCGASAKRVGMLLFADGKPPRAVARATAPERQRIACRGVAPRGILSAR